MDSGISGAAGRGLITQLRIWEERGSKRKERL